MKLNVLGTQPVPSWVGRISNKVEQSGDIAKVSSSTGEDTSRPEMEKEMELSKIVNKLQRRDRKVRQHETAHKVVAGPYAGPVVYSYQRGPRGQMYAVGGEVSIDTSKVPGDPEKTMEKARQIERAALAPAQPSGRDLQIAARARQMQLNARMELARDNRDNKYNRTKAMRSYQNQMKQGLRTAG